MENTIYAFWDAQQLQYILNAVAMMTSTDDYLGLLKTFAILGLFIAVTAGFVKARGEEAAYYVIVLVLFYGALFLPKRDVVIQDMATGTGTYTVANVPLGLAFFASAESHIGYWLTKVSETVFAMPDDIQFQKTGYMFASRAITERQKARFFKSSIFDSMLNFTKDCIYPEINNNPALYEQTMTTGDLWTLWGTPEALNAGRLVSVYNPTSSAFEIMNCQAAYGVLDPQAVSYTHLLNFGMVPEGSLDVKYTYSLYLDKLATSADEKGMNSLANMAFDIAAKHLSTQITASGEHHE